MLSRSRDIIRSATVDRVRSSKGLQALCLQLHLFSIRQRLCLVRYVDRRSCKIYYEVFSNVKFIESTRFRAYGSSCFISCLTQRRLWSSLIAVWSPSPFMQLVGLAISYFGLSDGNQIFYIGKSNTVPLQHF